MSIRGHQNTALSADIAGPSLHLASPLSARRPAQSGALSASLLSAMLFITEAAASNFLSPLRASMTVNSLPRKRRCATGCLTCRIRKVKCDEGKPTCARCTSTGRTCDGYSTLPFSRSDLRAASAEQGCMPRAAGLVSVLLFDTSFEDTVEKRYFQFFRACTVPSTISTVYMDLVLQFNRWPG